MSFFMDINSHYSQIQLALFSKALPYSTGSSFIFLFKRRGSHFSFFFPLLFQPSYFVLETRELLGQEMEPELQINQSCLMSSYCNTQSDVTGDWWMPHLHEQPTGSAGTHSAAIWWLPPTLIDTISSLPPSAASSALGRKGTCSWNSSLTKRWGFLAFSCKFCEAGFKRRNSWHLRSKFCPNSTVFAEIIFIWHFCPSLRVPKSLSGSTYHRRWLMLALSEEWMLAHPIWANQERRTTCMKPPDTLLDKSSHQKKSHSDEGWEEKSKM